MGKSALVWELRALLVVSPCAGFVMARVTMR